MTENDIIVAGEEVKYFIDIEHEGFSMLENDFQVELVYGMRGESFTLTKQEMTADSSGKYFFMFSTAGMVGKSDGHLYVLGARHRRPRRLCARDTRRADHCFRDEHPMPETDVLPEGLWRYWFC